MDADAIAGLKITTTLRLPVDMKLFLDQQAELNASSQNSEIIRAVRERMARVQREEMPAQAGE